MKRASDQTLRKKRANNQGSKTGEQLPSGQVLPGASRTTPRPDPQLLADAGSSRSIHQA
jgi:hypothetical protein